MKRKNKKKNQKMKPDDYYNVGPIEMARFGKVVVVKNNMTKEEHGKYIKLLADRHDTTVGEIDQLVTHIRELISSCEPLRTLQYGYMQFVQSLIGITSEVQLTREKAFSGKELEYIQSLMASTSIIYDAGDTDEDPSEILSCISYNIHRLYGLVQQYFIYFTAKQRLENPEISAELEEFMIESQMAMFYRGERYQVYELEHLNTLLGPHDEVFNRLFGIGVDSFIDGLQNIQKSLSEGLGLAFENLDTLMQAHNKYLLQEGHNFQSPNEAVEGFRDILKGSSDLMGYLEEFKNKFFGYDLFDLTLITDWPYEFQRKLSWGINENQSFFGSDVYNGWPIIEMPVYERPFICINDKCYCFDSYNLFDNIYRVIQRLVIKEEPEYQPIWSESQKIVTEDLAAGLFRKLMPGCCVYQSNYYPINRSLKNLAENDVLITYDDNLLIIEVKAGSYTHTPPITDITSHIQSLQTLVGKAETQASRTLEYLRSDTRVKLYDHDKQEKVELNLSDYREITKFCITLENFSEFAAKAEKIKFILLMLP